MSSEYRTSAVEAAERCIACDSASVRPWLAGLRDYITGEQFDLGRCKLCGLGMTLNAPRATDLSKYYPARYRGDRHAGTGLVRARLRAHAIERHFAPKFRGRLLDLGAGAGEFAVLMRARGWDVCATEADSAAVEALLQKGIDARLPSSAGGVPWTLQFDAVTCWHVLEHVHDPPGLLEEVRGTLKRDGTFQVTVPNLSSWQARLGGRSWFHLDVPRHLFHFTPSALERLLRRHGFEVLSRSSFALEYDWFGAVQTWLNSLLGRQNVLFEALTGVDRTFCPSLCASCLLAPIIASATILPTLSAGAVGAGATLTFTCRPAK